jgi:hypothetical protein
MRSSTSTNGGTHVKIVGTIAPESQSPGFITRHGFVLLFATLLVFLLFIPVSQELHKVLDPRVPPVMDALMFIFLLGGTAIAVSNTRAGKLAVAGIALPTAVLVVVHGVSGLHSVGAASDLLGIVFLSYAIIQMLRFIFSRQQVTTNTICASLCIYMLFGIVWAIGYSAIDAFDTEAFRSTIVGKQAFPQFGITSGRTMPVLYFSFCTLTTLGYGDIVPVSAMARALATLEAITGQLYLVVLVARLVGLHIAYSQTAVEKRS